MSTIGGSGREGREGERGEMGVCGCGGRVTSGIRTHRLHIAVCLPPQSASTASSRIMPLSPAQLVAIRALSVAHPRSLAAYSYGTSGFRGLASTLDSVVLRMGMMAAIRSWSIENTTLPHGAPSNSRANSATSPVSPSAAASSSTSSSAVSPIIGLVITASHNDAPDNGIKLVDPTGEMMNQSWESLASRIANSSEEGVGETLVSIMTELGLSSTRTARVFVARDTRLSSPHLTALAIKGAKALGAEVVDFGVATTPQLHWVVREANAGRTATFDAYYNLLIKSFQIALDCRVQPASATHDAPHPTPSSVSSSSSSSHRLTPLIVDCANGVGALAMKHFADRLSSIIQIERRNTGEGGLNAHCGAEHVQKSRALPAHFDLESDRGKKIASLDGDADRLVYCYVSMSTGQFRLLDGDKIIALYTLFLRDLLRTAGLDKDLSIGIVQTAYANGASTLYMQQQLGVDVQFTNTGVKHLHHKAVEFDIGVYFESNGHGTVVFSAKAQKSIHAAAHNTQQAPAKHNAARCLQALLDLINQCVGDAISDMLLVEVALYHVSQHTRHTRPLATVRSSHLRCVFSCLCCFVFLSVNPTAWLDVE